ncbi:MAG: deoxyribose-phosphate aldolase [Verrucomicrobiae bacterium]|nr:deoxyribose-phosphate aldolase [Verrucomicrobiae bacterium]NNJ43926.1 deoxyribose-phosphate aldolase [Akkermansiaceae bacterium]
MKEYTQQEVAATIDHAVLKPELTDTDVKEHAAMCIENSVFSMCVKPCDVKLAVALLKDSPVKVSCVLSFPHGADTTATKAFQAQQAIDDGVDEIDMVMNIGKFMSEDFDYVKNDITAVVDIAHPHHVLVKVIQESGYLSHQQITKACEISHEAGADFVKTSTGFGPGSATTETIDTMIKSVGDKMQVKASGGIRTWQQAVDFLEQGADRLGVGSTEAVLHGADAQGDY